MDKLRQAIIRGEDARKWLEDERVIRAWDETQAEITRMWGATQSEGAGKREELWREFHGLKALKARFQRIVAEGRKAEEELKHEQSDRARARSK